MRYDAVLDMRKRDDEHRVKNSLTYIPESSLITDLIDGFERIHDTFADIKCDSQDSPDQYRDSDTESEVYDSDSTEVKSELSMSDIPDIPLELIDKIYDQWI